MDVGMRMETELSVKSSSPAVLLECLIKDSSKGFKGR